MPIEANRMAPLLRYAFSNICDDAVVFSIGRILAPSACLPSLCQCLMRDTEDSRVEPESRKLITL